jgi:hypothetical protein
MIRKLLNIDKKQKSDRYASRRQGPISAAYIIAEAMEDSCRGSDPQFRGNVADALYHIATALQRIAEAMEKQLPQEPE